MCGIVGFTTPAQLSEQERLRRFAGPLRRMTASLYHRGPDAQQALLADGVGLGHTRLSIVDVAGGHQPMTDPDSGISVVFNGEIFNHVELRARLAAGYRFRTRSDTEVILAAFLREGIDCVRSFIGQFAFALWDPRDRSLWLARDRVGVRPLFYHEGRHGLAFASEAKAIFAGGWLAAELDRAALHQTLHLWAPVPPHSAFAGVLSLPPGCTACHRDGRLAVRRYWDLDLGADAVDHALTEPRALAQLDEILTDAVRLRLRADVPVAAYLSGGLDSSLICAIAQRELKGTLQTFSVGFEQARYDERGYQASVARALGTAHHQVLVGDRDIGELLPAVVDHAEQVLLRSAPAPFFRLSELVRSQGTKVVLTGEGADETFWGYDLFKETAIRQFWARQPQSAARPRLLGRLYPYMALSQQPPAMLRQFYGIGDEGSAARDFSHRIRWANSGRVARFLAPAFVQALHGQTPAQALLDTLPPAFAGWRPLARAQYLEMQTLLSGYLLSAQGDRMLMGHSVEGRFPFLDHRLIEFAARLPARMKLCGLKEKVILKRYARPLLPAAVAQRPKFPYRAPIAECLAGAAAPQWSRELLAREAVDRAGVFDGAKVERLVAKLAQSGAAPTEADNMALMAVATTQLLWRQFGAQRRIPQARIDQVELLGAPAEAAA